MTQAGSVKSISGGKFFSKDMNANIRELHIGDVVYENETIYGDQSNTKSSKLEIQLISQEIFALKEGQKQLIDASLIDTTFGKDEVTYSTQEALAAFEAHREIVDVVSDLRDANWADAKDATQEETSEGKEEAEDSQSEGDHFAARDGNMTNVESDLRKKAWIHTQSFREFDSNKDLLDHGTKELGKTPLNPFERPERPTDPYRPTNPYKPVDPTPDRPKSEITPDEPERPTTPPTPPTTEQIIIPKMSIDDVTMYEQDGFMVFTVTLDRPAKGDITVNYQTGDKTATAGKDYTHTTGTITIPSGSSTAQIKIPINDDYYYENSEQYTVTLSNPTGRVEIIKPVGVGTILDNPPTYNGNVEESDDLPDSSTGTYDKDDTVYLLVKEVGGNTIIKIVDKNGEEVKVPDGKSIEVPYGNGSDKATIVGGSSSITLTGKTNITVNNITQDSFENLVYVSTKQPNVSSYEDASTWNQKPTGNKAEGGNKIPLDFKYDKLVSLDKEPSGSYKVELTFNNGTAVSGAKLFVGTTQIGADITADNQKITIYVVENGATKPSDGKIYLTKAEYESLKIQHAEDNDINIKISSNAFTNTMTVEILPVTDDIKIFWDTATGGTISTKDGKDNALFTFNTTAQNSAKTTLDLKAIMSSTSGAQNGTDGTKGDLDGSELRSYTISGLPAGSEVTIGGQKVTAGFDGTVTINLTDANNKVLDHSDFKIELPAYFSGTINGKITLNVIDKGVEEKSDNSKWGETKSDSIEFKYVVTPTIVGATSSIGTGQDGNLEDAGRENSNYENNKNNWGSNGHISNGNITDPTKGIKLIINPQGGNTNPYEKLLVSVDKLPVDSAIWIYDSASGTNKLVGVESDGKIYEYTKNTTTNEWTNKSELSGGEVGNIKLETNGAEYKITIKDYKNDTDHYPRFIPPHNAEKTGSTNTDKYHFEIESSRVIYDLDGTVLEKKDYETGSGKIFNMYVDVKGVADEPINTELTDNPAKFIEISGVKYLKATEDTSFYLKDIYKNTPSSYDNDGSEVLFIKVTLPSGYSMQGYDTKDGNVYSIKATDINGAYITFPTHKAGITPDITLQYITQELSGSSKTHYKENIKLFIEAVVDDVNVAAGSTIYEDNDGALYKSGKDGNGNTLTNKINIQPTLKDTDGSESITSVKILASSVKSGYELYLDSSMTQPISSKLVGAYYVLTKEEANSIYGKNTVENVLNGNFDLTVVYTVQDTDGQNTITKDWTKTHTVTVQAVTDTPTLTVTDATGSTNIDVDNATTIHGNPKVTVNGTGDFTIDIKTTSPDIDSEKVEMIEIRGVPDGASIEGARWAYQTAQNNNVWIIDGTNISSRDTTIDSDGANTSIKFSISSANFTTQDITFITYTRDGSDYQETATQKVQLNSNVTIAPGGGGGDGNPIIIDLGFKQATIYEDNDSNPTTPNTKDGQYYIGHSFTAAAHSGSGTDGGKWTVKITDLPAGVTLSGHDYSYVDGGKTYYVVAGMYPAGSNGQDVANTVINRLDQVKVNLPADKNSSQDGGKFLEMKFSAKIENESAGRHNSGTGITEVESTTNILPVTDEMTIAIGINSTINEDSSKVPLNITLTNPNDATKTELVGNKLYIKVTETWNDDNFSGAPGKLEDDGSGKYNVVWDATNSRYEITPTDPAYNFAVGTPITGIVYTPAENRAGTVKFDVSTQNKEVGNGGTIADSTVIFNSSESKTITVKSVWDFKPGDTTVGGTSTEDTPVGILPNAVKVNITTLAVNDDTSEKYTKVVLDGIPNGMTVYYKNSSGNLVLASNLGSTSTNGKYNLNPQDTSSQLEDRNKWQIPVTGGVLPEIYVSAPANWAGDFSFKTEITLSEYGLGEQKFTIDNSTVSITAVADGVTGSATKDTSATIYNWVNLNLNANMKDVDSSEVLNLKISGLSNDAKFELLNGGFASKYTAALVGSDWVIKGIKHTDIGQIKFMDTSASSGSVTATGTTQEINKDNSLGAESDSHNFGEVAVINNISSVFRFNGAEINFDNVNDINSKFTGVTQIDLASDAKANTLTNLKLSDVLAMADGANEIKIFGGSNDTVDFKNDGNTWSKGSTISDGGKTFDIYTNSAGGTLQVKVEQAIQDHII